MKKSVVLKAGLALVGTVLVGALGSGLWEVAVKPALGWVIVFLLDVATLGTTSLEDGIYIEVARGNYERVSESIYVLIISFMCVPFIIFGTVPLVKRAFDRSLTRSRARTVKDENENENENEDENEDAGLKFGLFILFNLGLAIFAIIHIAQTIYINRAANHLDQMHHIVSPVVTEENRLILRSRMAQIESRGEYTALVQEMESLARNYSLNVPTFDIW